MSDKVDEAAKDPQYDATGCHLPKAQEYTQNFRSGTHFDDTVGDLVASRVGKYVFRFRVQRKRKDQREKEVEEGYLELKGMLRLLRE